MQPGQEAPMSINQLQSMAMSVIDLFCSIFTMPIEIILRPQYGTRYFQVPTIFFSSMLMLILPLFSSAATGLVNMIPFHRAAPGPVGLFGIGSLSSLYFFLVFLHGFRLWRRMVYMELELHSEFEGPPLPFFRLIPWSSSWAFTRIVLEPVFVFIGASLLEGAQIFQSGLATYLHFAAFMLAMRSFIQWYRGWEYVRKIMDGPVIGKVIGNLLQNKASEQELASVHLASFPKNISAELRTNAALHIARAYGIPTGKEQSHE